MYICHDKTISIYFFITPEYAMAAFHIHVNKEHNEPK